MTKRNKQKIRASMRRVLKEIQTAMETMESERATRENPFSKTGAMRAEYLNSIKAYEEMAEEVDAKVIDRISEQIEKRAWVDEEYAKAASFLVQIAHHMGAFV
tara:strand:- start:3630 stop:3938 length:309 start_codon:yes stop_codon:yes gene_type:complete